MTTDERGLLAAIWAGPHEDTPRLVYADWLQEHDQPERAEFIRVQCELARLGEWDERSAALKAREQALLAAHAAGWRAKVPKKWEQSPFHRGFLRLDLSKVPFEKLTQLTVRQLGVAPLARYHYNLRGNEFDAFLTWPGAVFQELFGPRPVRPDGWADRLAACGNLRNVSEVAFIEIPLKSDEIRAILDTWADRYLTKLTLADRTMRDDALALLSGHRGTAKLQQLTLRNGELTPAGVHTLCESPHLGGLRELEFWSGQFGDACAVELARSPRLSSIRSLRLSTCGVGDEGAIALAKSPHAAGLRVLNLYSNEIGPDGLRALARSPYLERLTYLDVPNNPGTKDAAAVKKLRARFGRLAHFRV